MAAVVGYIANNDAPLCGSLAVNGIVAGRKCADIPDARAVEQRLAGDWGFIGEDDVRVSNPLCSICLSCVVSTFCET